jgi:hypothetical protein
MSSLPVFSPHRLAPSSQPFDYDNQTDSYFQLPVCAETDAFVVEDSLPASPSSSGMQPTAEPVIEPSSPTEYAPTVPTAATLAADLAVNFRDNFPNLKKHAPTLMDLDESPLRKRPTLMDLDESTLPTRELTSSSQPGPTSSTAVVHIRTICHLAACVSQNTIVTYFQFFFI